MQWFYGTVVLLHEPLAENGSIYVHLDYHVSHYAKVVSDEVLGPGMLFNEISWKRTFAHGSSDRYGPVHDLILFFVKGNAGFAQFCSDETELSGMKQKDPQALSLF